MKKAFLKFMEHVIEKDCPFNQFSVSTYTSFVDVVFDKFTSIRQEHLGWINTHLEGGRWRLIAENNSIILIIRFDESNND